MKNINLRLAVLYVAAVFLAACNEKNNNPEPELTNCAGCQFLFTEDVDVIKPGYHFGVGQYRVFWADIKKGPLSQKVFIKAPMQGTSFTLTKADILAEKVEVLDDCPSCNIIAMKAVDGSVKGTRATPFGSADKARWLIEARIIREPINNTLVYRDTVYVKQYFAANFIID